METSTIFIKPPANPGDQRHHEPAPVRFITIYLQYSQFSSGTPATRDISATFSPMRIPSKFWCEPTT
jgi:hypothetical protein